MAKSFHTIIDEGVFEVDHKGDLVTLDLPDLFLEIKGLTEDKKALMAWVAKHNLELPVIQCAIQKRIIELRAIARPTVKKYKDKENFDSAMKKIVDPENWNIDPKNLELSLKITADDKCQDRLDKAEWTKVDRPGSGTKENVKKETEINTVKEAIKPWLAMGKTSDEIKEIYGAVFSASVLAIAINNAKDELDS
jgi:hypothetical protein